MCVFVSVIMDAQLAMPPPLSLSVLPWHFSDNRDVCVCESLCVLEAAFVWEVTGRQGPPVLFTQSLSDNNRALSVHTPVLCPCHQWYTLHKDHLCPGGGRGEGGAGGVCGGGG